MILDGKKLTGEILARTKARAEKLPHSPKILAIVANETAATKSYLAIKEKRAIEAGCVLEVARFPDSVSAETLRLAITMADAEAIIVQLPLPAHIDAQEVCDAIPLGKDADVLSTLAHAKFEADEPDVLVPPVAAAVAEILKFSAMNSVGKKAAVVGRGWLVGAPCATLLAQLGAEVTVVDINTKPAEFAAALMAADIIVSGAGSPHLIKPDMIKDGVILIDAGTSESSGKIVGDADPACAEKCLLFTPVPGGVGPVAVGKLFENAVTLVRRST